MSDESCEVCGGDGKVVEMKPETQTTEATGAGPSKAMQNLAGLSFNDGEFYYLCATCRKEMDRDSYLAHGCVKKPQGETVISNQHGIMECSKCGFLREGEEHLCFNFSTTTRAYPAITVENGVYYFRCQECSQKMLGKEYPGHKCQNKPQEKTMEMRIKGQRAKEDVREFELELLEGVVYLWCNGKIIASFNYNKTASIYKGDIVDFGFSVKIC